MKLRCLARNRGDEDCVGEYTRVRIGHIHGTTHNKTKYVYTLITQHMFISILKAATADGIEIRTGTTCEGGGANLRAACEARKPGSRHASLLDFAFIENTKLQNTRIILETLKKQ